MAQNSGSSQARQLPGSWEILLFFFFFLFWGGGGRGVVVESGEDVGAVLKESGVGTGGCCDLLDVTKWNCSHPTWAPLETFFSRYLWVICPAFFCVHLDIFYAFLNILPSWLRLQPNGRHSHLVILLAALQAPPVTEAMRNHCFLTQNKFSVTASDGFCFTWTNWGSDWDRPHCWSRPYFHAILSRQRWSDSRWSACPKWTMKACQTVQLHKSAGRRLTGDVSCHRPSQQTETHKSYVILLSFMYSRHKTLLSLLPKTRKTRRNDFSPNKTFFNPSGFNLFFSTFLQSWKWHEMHYFLIVTKSVHM